MNLVGIWEHFAFATAALISLIIIFMYKKRKLQISLSTWLVIPLYITGIAIILFFSEGHYDESKDMTTLAISFFVGLVSTILAIFSIRKDEKTVQESNRLR
jgi:TctA family transporter